MELTCIGCPLGCQITVSGNGEISGYTCQRGKAYAQKETTAPERSVTGTVHITGSSADKMLPVRTKSDIPKAKIFDVMEEIRKTTVTAPVRTGDIIIENAAGTGVPVTAAKTVL